MANQTLAIDTARRPEVSSTFAQIAVLAGLSATGTLATNILLPSLPQMAASLNVSSAAVTSAITIFLAVFALGQLVVGPISDRYGRRSDLPCSSPAASGVASPPTCRAC